MPVKSKRGEPRSRFYCPDCRTGQPSKVIDSRSSVGGTIRRRRECLRCGGRFTTYEMTETQVEERTTVRVAVLAAEVRAIADRAAPAAAETEAGT